jgi:hypothetical protein
LVKLVVTDDGTFRLAGLAVTIELTSARVAVGSCEPETVAPALIAPSTMAMAAQPATITRLASKGGFMPGL